MGEQFFLSDQAIADFGLTLKGLYLCCDNEPIYFIVPIPCDGGLYVKEVNHED
jgi:hypothetical protein